MDRIIYLAFADELQKIAQEAYDPYAGHPVMQHLNSDDGEFTRRAIGRPIRAAAGALAGGTTGALLSTPFAAYQAVRKRDPKAGLRAMGYSAGSGALMGGLIGAATPDAEIRYRMDRVS